MDRGRVLSDVLTLPAALADRLTAHIGLSRKQSSISRSLRQFLSARFIGVDRLFVVLSITNDEVIAVSAIDGGGASCLLCSQALPN